MLAVPREAPLCYRWRPDVDGMGRAAGGRAGEDGREDFRRVDSVYRRGPFGGEGFLQGVWAERDRHQFNHVRAHAAHHAGLPVEIPPEDARHAAALYGYGCQGSGAALGLRLAEQSFPHLQA